MLYIHLFLANLIWGLNVIVTKLNYDSFHPLFLAMIKILFSVLALLFYIYYKKISFEKVSIKKLIVSLCKWNWKILISFMMSFLGFLLAIHFRLFNIGKGIFFLITALFIYNFGNYRLKDITHNPFIYNLYMLLIAFFEFIVILLFQKNDLFKTVNTFSLWLFILTSGIGYAYIQCVYFLSIHSIGPLKTSFFMAFSPAFTYFFSLILLKEKFDFFVLIGFIVIFTTSFYFISKKEN